jgi:hypothetical protein
MDREKSSGSFHAPSLLRRSDLVRMTGINILLERSFWCCEAILRHHTRGRERPPPHRCAKAAHAGDPDLHPATRSARRGPRACAARDCSFCFRDGTTEVIPCHVWMARKRVVAQADHCCFFLSVRSDAASLWALRCPFDSPFDFAQGFGLRPQAKEGGGRPGPQASVVSQKKLYSAKKAELGKTILRDRT